MYKDKDFIVSIMGKDISKNIEYLDKNILGILNLKSIGLKDYGNFDSYYMVNRDFTSEYSLKAFEDFKDKLFTLETLGKLNKKGIIITKDNYYLLKYNFVWTKESYIKLLELILDESGYFDLNWESLLIKDIFHKDMDKYGLTKKEKLNIFNRLDCRNKLSMKFILSTCKYTNNDDLEYGFFLTLLGKYKKNLENVVSVFIKTRNLLDSSSYMVDNYFEKSWVRYLPFFVVNKRIIKSNVGNILRKINYTDSDITKIRYVNELCLVHSTYLESCLNSGNTNEVTDELDKNKEIILKYINSMYFYRNKLLLAYVKRYY